MLYIAVYVIRQALKAKMGKLISYDPKYHYNYTNHKSKNLKVMHKISKTVKKTVKVTYISSPVFVSARDASEFRSLVQQLTGKDSNHETPKHRENPPTCKVMQVDGGTFATTAADEEDNASSCCYNRSMDSLEFDEELFWSEAARCISLPSYVFA